MHSTVFIYLPLPNSPRHQLISVSSLKAGLCGFPSCLPSTPCKARHAASVQCIENRSGEKWGQPPKCMVSALWKEELAGTFVYPREYKEEVRRKKIRQELQKRCSWPREDQGGEKGSGGQCWSGGKCGRQTSSWRNSKRWAWNEDLKRWEAPSTAHPGLEPSDHSSRHMQGQHLERPLPAIHVFDLLLSVLWQSSLHFVLRQSSYAFIYRVKTDLH